MKALLIEALYDVRDRLLMAVTHAQRDDLITAADELQIASERLHDLLHELRAEQAA